MNICRKFSKPSLKPVNLVFLFGILLLSSLSLFAQSRQQNLPTPVVRNEVSGAIKARDLGDSRLTTYFYEFKGDRGDIFVNVVTKNFNGDIDIFLVEGLKPKTKITIYADSGLNETGRVIYLRKPERLLMRVQGRTPNDDPATYQVKFAGSFQALLKVARKEDDELPKVEEAGEGTVKVNSVGTIIEDPNSKEEDAKKEETSEAEEKKAEISSTFDPTKKPETRIKEVIGETRPRVTITDPFADKAKKDDEKNVTVEITDKTPKRSALITIERDTDEDPVTDKKAAERKPTPSELRRIKLVLILKNGDKIERRMNKISSVNVFDGVLKVVGTDGKVEKFSILDIAKMTIE